VSDTLLGRLINECGKWTAVAACSMSIECACCATQAQPKLIHCSQSVSVCNVTHAYCRLPPWLANLPNLTFLDVSANSNLELKGVTSLTRLNSLCLQVIARRACSPPPPHPPTLPAYVHVLNPCSRDCNHVGARLHICLARVYSC
jgi:hypothetical protein